MCAASLRDHDIVAIVCHGGLIDLTGMFYLHSLESPLLMLVEKNDTARIASSKQALQEIRCRTEIKLIAEIGFDYTLSLGFDQAAQASVNWFSTHFRKEVKHV